MRILKNIEDGFNNQYMIDRGKNAREDIGYAFVSSMLYMFEFVWMLVKEAVRKRRSSVSADRRKRRWKSERRTYPAHLPLLWPAPVHDYCAPRTLFATNKRGNNGQHTIADHNACLFRMARRLCFPTRHPPPPDYCLPPPRSYAPNKSNEDRDVI